MSAALFLALILGPAPEAPIDLGPPRYSQPVWIAYQDAQPAAQQGYVWVPGVWTLAAHHQFDVAPGTDRLVLRAGWSLFRTRMSPPTDTAVLDKLAPNRERRFPWDD